MLDAIAAGRMAPEEQIVSSFEDLPNLLARLKERDFSGKPLIRL